MNLFTHLGISMKLKHIIETNYHIKLRTISFLLGSIKPDITSPYIHIPHYKKDSQDFIREEIRSVLETKIYESKKCTSHFSGRLGIITHYLSDFFCYAHSEYFTGDMLEHNIYEMKLSLYCIFNSKKITQSGFANNVIINQNISFICGHIDELHIKYLYACNKACPSIDMAFTLKACTSLCFSIITACVAGEERFSNTVEEVFS